jgi:hypothetical protein
MTIVAVTVFVVVGLAVAMVVVGGRQLLEDERLGDDTPEERQ